MAIFYAFLVYFFFPFSYASSLSITEEWGKDSDPLRMGKNLEARFFALPLHGQVAHSRKFWSGDYWPLNKGNINFRWHADRNFMLNSPTLEELRRLRQQDIAQLSPAEKFDLLNGRYDYPLKREVLKIANLNAKNWEGICHGWAPAAINHNEPTPKVLINPEGIQIPFGSSDIKAILSYYYAYPYKVQDTHQVGRRCYNSRVTVDNDCRHDLNAGAFHLILANKIALENEGFIADLSRYKEVWNHPIKSYQSRVISEARGRRRNSAPGTTRTVRVSTRIKYADETSNDWNTVQGTSLQRINSTEFSYILEIDIYGQIIGGEWSSIRRPDFLWTMEKPTKFLRDFARLAELLND